MDIPWAVEQVHRRLSEVVRKDMVHLVVGEQHSPLAQVSTPLEQVGEVRTLRAQVYSHSHSQGSGEERHWKLKTTHLVRQASFGYS